MVGWCSMGTLNDPCFSWGNAGGNWWEKIPICWYLLEEAGWTCGWKIVRWWEDGGQFIIGKWWCFSMGQKTWRIMGKWWNISVFFVHPAAWGDQKPNPNMDFCWMDRSMRFLGKENMRIWIIATIAGTTFGKSNVWIDQPCYGNRVGIYAIYIYIVICCKWYNGEFVVFFLWVLCNLSTYYIQIWQVFGHIMNTFFYMARNRWKILVFTKNTSDVTLPIHFAIFFSENAATLHGHCPWIDFFF